MATPTSSSAASASSETSTDIRAPLWDHVNIVEKAASGGNTRWQCKYCDHNGFSSYTRVEAHLLQILAKGINLCNKVTFKMLTLMRNEVQRCKELVQSAKTRTVPMPTAPASSAGIKKNKKGPVSALEKSWALQDRKHLDALIARAFYSGGVPFNLSINPYLREAFTFAANTNLQGYQIPGYNKFREGLLREERAHIDKLLSSTKSTWDQKGVTICADGWTDPQRRPLINFVAMYGNSAMFLRADNCEGEVKTKEYIVEKLKSIIEEVGRHNVVQIITDNAANCKGVGLLIEAEYDNRFWTPCVVHTLNLALKSICEPKLPRNEEEQSVWQQLEFINTIRRDAAIIEKFIMNHGMRLSMFKKFSRLKLLSIAETRFASVVRMLKRMVEVKMAIKQMVISEEWAIYKDDDQISSFVHDMVLNEMWWKNVGFVLLLSMT